VAERQPLCALVGVVCARPEQHAPPLRSQGVVGDAEQ